MFIGVNLDTPYTIILVDTPYHHITCERHQFYLLVGDKLNSNKLLLVLECLKGRAQVRASFCLSRGQLWNAVKGLKGPHILFETFEFSPLSTHGVKPYFHRM